MIDKQFLTFTPMTMEMHFPAPPLGQFIESFIYYKDYRPDHHIDRFFPDGNIYAIIDLTEEPKYIFDNQTLRPIQTCRKVWFSGLRTGFISIPSCGESEMFVINFRKGRALPFVRGPLSAFTDSVVDGEQSFRKDILQVREALIPLPGAGEKFTCAEKLLMAQYGSSLDFNPCIDYAVNQILLDPAQTTITKLSSKIGYSHKHLIRLFRDHTGLSPKEFLKIIRFQKAITRIDQPFAEDWTGIAAASGYYDQAHFIHEFKNYSGFTPARFLERQRVFTNYVAVE